MTLPSDDVHNVKTSIPLSEPLQGFSDATGLNLHIGKAHKESHNRISLSETPQNARKFQPHK